MGNGSNKIHYKTVHFDVKQIKTAGAEGLTKSVGRSRQDYSEFHWKQDLKIIPHTQLLQCVSGNNETGDVGFTQLRSNFCEQFSVCFVW